MTSVIETQETIYKTFNYSQFVIPNWQRNLAENQVKKIMSSMQEHGNLMKEEPAKVRQRDDGCLVLINGQHRLEAAQRLGEAFFYVIVTPGTFTHEKLQAMSRATSQWDKEDALNSYAARNFPAYTFVKELTNDMGVGIAGVSYFVGNTQDERENFQYGGLTLTEDERQEAIEFFHLLTEVREKLGSCVNKVRFIRALKQVTEMEGFDKQRLLSRLKTVGNRYSDRPKTQEVVDELLSIYNYRTHSKYRL